MHKRNFELDSLRALSITLVVLAHAGMNFIPGGLGVTIFFVISGYIITKLVIQEITNFGDFKIGFFFLRRFWKIFPPFLALILLPSLFLYKIKNIEAPALTSQILMYFNWYKIENGSSGVLPGSGVVWSLSIEEQFYVLLPVIIILILRMNKKTFKKILGYTFIAFWTLSTIIRSYFAFSHRNSFHDSTGNLPRIYLGTDTRLSSICAGGVIAIFAPRLLVRYSKVSNKSNCILTVSILFMILSLTFRNSIFRDSLRFTIQELSICLVIITGVVLKAWPDWLIAIARLSLIQRIGVSSYSIYLSHLTLLILFVNTSLYKHLAVSNFLLSTIMGFIVIVVGIGLHSIVDSPFERMRKSFRR